MEIKIIVSGLDNAGKTSILTALDKKYDFQKDIMALSPTMRVEYHSTNFLGQKVIFWDMGGQLKYRELYQQKKDFYFDSTDLLLYIIDIQDSERYKSSLEYLDGILEYFKTNNMDVPLILSFHKFDPEIRADGAYFDEIQNLKEIILNKYPNLKVLFQKTSIFDLISIIQLVSYGLSVFDTKFFDLSELLENYLNLFNCQSLILFDKNGIIVSEYYTNEIESHYYIELIESIKEHIFLVKRMQEESYDVEYTLRTYNTDLLSYLHKITVGKETFFISVILQEALKETFLEQFTEFLGKLQVILMPLLS